MGLEGIVSKLGHQPYTSGKNIAGSEVVEVDHTKYLRAYTVAAFEGERKGASG